MFLKLSEKCNFLIFNRNNKENVIFCLFLQLKVFRFFYNFPQLILTSGQPVLCMECLEGVNYPPPPGSAHEVIASTVIDSTAITSTVIT